MLYCVCAVDRKMSWIRLFQDLFHSHSITCSIHKAATNRKHLGGILEQRNDLSDCRLRGQDQWEGRTSNLTPRAPRICNTGGLSIPTSRISSGVANLPSTEKMTICV